MHQSGALRCISAFGLHAPYMLSRETEKSDPLAFGARLWAMDARTHSALDLGWRLVRATLAGLRDLTGRSAGWLPGPAWSRAFGQLRRAEAAARRLLLILAENLAAKAVPEARPRHAPAAKPGENRSKTPGFALFDPLPDLRLPASDSAAVPALGSLPVHATTGLESRLCALAALVADPAPAIRRMACWLARRASSRTSPLRPGLPPGVCGDLMDRDQDVVMVCDALARERLNRPLPP